MQLETRVVNLGKRGGLVVRRFPLPGTPEPSPMLKEIIRSYLDGEIGPYRCAYIIDGLGYAGEFFRCYPRKKERR